MKKKNNDINIKTIWKFFRSEKGKRYSFIIFYIFFFIFLFIFMNIDYKTDNNVNKEEKEDIPMISSLPFETSNLENNNYNFKYIINCKEQVIYDANKNNNLYTFKNNNIIYTFELINGNLTGIEKIDYIDFSNIYFLRQVIKNSKLISETKLNETNEYVYTYKIKNNELSNYLNKEINNDNLSEINIKTDNNKKIKSFKIDLSSYENNICNIEYQLEAN